MHPTHDPHRATAGVEPFVFVRAGVRRPKCRDLLSSGLLDALQDWNDTGETLLGAIAQRFESGDVDGR
jgi:hypothetical protein